MLNPLILNDYSLKDTFDAANRIKNIPKDLLNNNYDGPEGSAVRALPEQISRSS